jgi:hypothetical protein
MKKIIRYLITLAILFFVAYNSVYFKKLDEVKASASKQFDAKSYARKYVDTKLLPAMNNTLDIDQLMGMVAADKENTFNKYSHALGIGNIKYFLVKGEGVINSIGDDNISILTGRDSAHHNYTIATEYVYGNAVRDASGLIDINEFTNTTDLNNVSAEINNIIRKEVLPPFMAKMKKGDAITFYGAIELNKEHLKTDNIEIIPISLNITNK